MSDSLNPRLKGHLFFRSFADPILDELAACGRLRSFKKGTMIALEEDEADCFYAVVDGRVAIETTIPGKEPRVVQTLHAGEVVGWSWIFPPYRWCFAARTVKDSTLIEFDARCLRAKVDTNHELGFVLMKHFAKVMTQRLKASRLQLVDMYGKGDD